jgi:hypothetical protein
MDPVTIAAIIGVVGQLGSAMIGGANAPAQPAGRSEAQSTTDSTFESRFASTVSPNNDGSIRSPFTQSFDNSFTVSTAGNAAANRLSLPDVSTLAFVGGAVLIAAYLYKQA